jgi:aspartate kinase
VSLPRILVQKFGGTSVATAERRALAIGHVRRARDEGYSVAIVVSAMGRKGEPYATDTLLGLLSADGAPVDERDYDLIFTTGEAISAAVMAHSLRAAGIPAVPMTAAQAGIYTDGHHREAEVIRVDPSHMVEALAQGSVPVIAGGQGVIPGTLAYTTLGRGGSDTSGVIVGVALNAAKVEIFTDVPGVAIVDPRFVANAPFLDRVSYGAMHELARFGATVVHPRAVGVARSARMPTVVRSTFATATGTLIGDVPDEQAVVGIASMRAVATTTISVSLSDGARAELEHEGITILVDRSSGVQVAGAGMPADELEAILDRAGVAHPGPARPLAWISAVGFEDALEEVFGEGAEALAGLGVVLDESGAMRHTWLLPAPSAERAVEVLYGRLVESRGGNRMAALQRTRLRAGSLGARAGRAT